MQDRKRARPKRVVLRTERQRQKRSVAKPQTKARLRRRFEARLRDLVTALRKFERTRVAADRERLLRDALRLLDAALDEKPQSHVLKDQKRLCLDALGEILADPARAIDVRLDLLLDQPDAIRPALKARIHPPASERKSWN